MDALKRIELQHRNESLEATSCIQALRGDKEKIRIILITRYSIAKQDDFEL